MCYQNTYFVRFLSAAVLVTALSFSCSSPTANQPSSGGNVTGTLTTSGSVLFQDTLSSFDSSLWTESNWGNGGMFNCGFVPSAVSFASGAMNLTLTNTASSGTPYSSGEYATKTAYGYGVYETRMKPAAAAGIVSSFFLYTNTPVWDEIDIEFLGKDTTKVQFNYFVNGVGGHEHLHTLGFDASQGYHWYSIDYQSTGIRWYVDGVLAYTVNAGTGVTLPSHPMKVFANLWPGTGVDSWLDPFVYSAPLTASYDAFKGSSGVVTGVVSSGKKIGFEGTSLTAFAADESDVTGGTMAMSFSYDGSRSESGVQSLKVQGTSRLNAYSTDFFGEVTVNLADSAIGLGSTDFTGKTIASQVYLPAGSPVTAVNLTLLDASGNQVLLQQQSVTAGQWNAVSFPCTAGNINYATLGASAVFSGMTKLRMRFETTSSSAFLANWDSIDW